MSKHYAVVMGKRVRKKYRLHYKFHYKFCDDIYIDAYLENIDQVTIFAGEIKGAPLEINEQLYINNLDLNVEILQKARRTDGGFIYYTEHIVEIVEDEKTVDSLMETEKKMKEHYETKIRNLSSPQNQDQNKTQKKRGFFEQLFNIE